MPRVFRAFEIVTIDVEWQIVFFIVNVLGNLRDGGGGRSLRAMQRRWFVLVRGIVERMIHVDIINIVLVIGYLPGRFKFTKFVRKSVVTVVRAESVVSRIKIAGEFLVKRIVVVIKRTSTGLFW